MPENPTKYFIGIMSGTSMDGIETVLTQIDSEQVKTLLHRSTEFPAELQSSLHKIAEDKQATLQTLGETDVMLADTYAKAVLELLDEANLPASDVIAIGCHGQTIYHSITESLPFSWQIGNPSVIAERTGITTVSDFRMADIAAGGEGAPLAPGFHAAAFRDNGENRAILNLGGIGNLTLLPKDPNSLVLGFDTGPANTLMDRWISQHQGQAFDESGNWARQGTVIESLLKDALAHPYFKQGIPKSTGREDFNPAWIDTLVTGQNYSPVDVQRTLLELSAISMADGFHLLKERCDREQIKLYACGGGTRNPFLLERIAAHCNIETVETTSKLGVSPEEVEATAFALFAYQTLNKLPSNIPSVTGASKPKILGGIYHP